MYASSWGAMLADKAGNLKRPSAFGLSYFVATIAAALGGFSTSLLGLAKSVYHVDLVTGNRFLFISVAAISLIGPMIVYLRVSESKPETSLQSGFHILPSKSRGVVFRYAAYGIVIALGAGMEFPLFPAWPFSRTGPPTISPGPFSAALISFER